MRKFRRRPVSRRQEQEQEPIMGLGLLVKDALQRLRPKWFRRMQESGELDPYLRDQDRAASNLVGSLLDRGYQHPEAMEVFAEEFLLPIEPEPGVEDEDEEPESAPPESPTPQSPTRRTRRRLRLLDTTTESPPTTPGD